MGAIYHLVVAVADNGPTLAPVLLAACWYGFATSVVAEEDDPAVSCRPAYVWRRR